MKNVNLDILFNIGSYKKNFSSNLESLQDKIPGNYIYKNTNNISSTKYLRQSLTKFHRPLTSKVKSHSKNKQKNNYKINEFIKPIPILYNSNINKDKNNSSGINAKENDYTYNLINTTKINLNHKINGKNMEDLFFKNINSLPEIREENNLIKKSISIINQSKERASKINSTKKNLFSNINDKNQIVNNNINNIKIYNNDINKKNQYKTNNNRYSIEDNNNEKKENYYANNINNMNKNVINIIKENVYAYDNNVNIMFLRSLESRLKKDHFSLLNSYQSNKKTSNESKNNNKNNNDNNINKYNIVKVQSDIKGITNLIITNQKTFPEKNFIVNNQPFLYESYEQINNAKNNYDKNNSTKPLNLHKNNTFKEKELIKFPNLKCLYYLILPGNASYLVENCMKHRINWIKPFSVVSTLYNFKWQELSYGIDYSSLGCFQNIKQIVNHFENHFVISNKAKMFINLLNYCEKRNISIFKYVPFTIIFNLRDDNEMNKDIKKNTIDKNNKYDNLKEMINSVEKFVINYEEIGHFYQNENYKKFITYLRSKERRGDYKNLNYCDYKKLSKRKKKLLRKYKKRNMISNNLKKRDTESEKENKNKIADYTLYSDYFNNLIEENSVPIYDKNKEKAYEEENNKIMNKYGNNTDEKNIIGNNTCIEIPKTHYSGKNLWIIKAINLNRGMCMKIVDSYDRMIRVINKFKEGVDYNFTKEKIEENNNEINVEIKSNKNLNKFLNPKNKFITSRMLRKNLNSADKTKTIMFNKDIIVDKNRVRLSNKNNLNSANKNMNARTSIMDNQNNSNIEINKNKLEEEKKINEIKEKEKLYNCNRIIIQKYIENPLLYKGRKFDMRIWVLLTHTMKVFVFKEGHLKTCSIEYNLNSKDAYAHITNYSFQKYNTNFQKYEKGNEVPFFEFQNFLNEKYPEKNYDIKKNLLPQIKEIIKITMRSAKYKINKNRRNYQFEIFGYDFMMDINFNIFLIEINTNPGLEESSPWIKIIVPRMLDDALRLTIDQLFETKYDFDMINKNKTKEDTSVYNSMLNSYIKVTRLKDDSEKKEENSVDYNNNDSYKDEKKMDSNKITNNQLKNKNIDNKQKKYISPFPVPGYSQDENIWDLVCDLDDPDPLDELQDKEEEITNENEKNNYAHKSHLGKSSKKGKKEKTN